MSHIFVTPHGVPGQAATLLAGMDLYRSGVSVPVPATATVTATAENPAWYKFAGLPHTAGVSYEVMYPSVIAPQQFAHAWPEDPVETVVIPSGISGLSTSDLSVTLYKDGEPQTTPTVTEDASSNYLASGWSTGAAGHYSLVWGYAGFYYAKHWVVEVAAVDLVDPGFRGILAGVLESLSSMAEDRSDGAPLYATLKDQNTMMGPSGSTIQLAADAAEDDTTLTLKASTGSLSGRIPPYLVLTLDGTDYTVASEVEQRRRATTVSVPLTSGLVAAASANDPVTLGASRDVTVPALRLAANRHDFFDAEFAETVAGGGAITDTRKGFRIAKAAIPSTFKPHLNMGVVLGEQGDFLKAKITRELSVSWEVAV